MLDIKQEIKSAFSENKTAIVAAIVIFVVALVLGYLLEPYVHSLFNPLVEDLTNKVETGVIKLTFWSIFSNNIRIAFSMFVYGLLFCFSAIILAYNGFFTSYYVATSNDLTYTLLLIIPHGLFEFPACILACASGFVLFNFVYKYIKTLLSQKNNTIIEKMMMSFEENFDKLKHAIILFIISAILMAIAGFIEVYLTIPIADIILSVFG